VVAAPVSCALRPASAPPAAVSALSTTNVPLVAVMAVGATVVREAGEAVVPLFPASSAPFAKAVPIEVTVPAVAPDCVAMTKVPVYGMVSVVAPAVAATAAPLLATEPCTGVNAPKAPLPIVFAG